MVTIERAINGVTAYLDRELVPHLPGWKAVAVSGVAALYAAHAPKIIDKMKSIPAVLRQPAGVYLGKRGVDRIQRPPVANFHNGPLRFVAGGVISDKHPVLPCPPRLGF